MKNISVIGLAAAASLSVLAVAAPASATATFTLVSSSMDQEYVANIAVPGQGTVTAYTGPITFQVSGYPGGDTSLFGFCFDIYHDMNLGSLNWTYTTNQPDGGGLVANAPQALDAGQVTTITNLVDTGWIMEMEGTAPDLAAQEAAIQAAIWNVEAPGSVSGLQSWAGGAQGVTDTALVNAYYQLYSTQPVASWTLADANDKVFSIYNGANQSFAIGWPIGGVPEPAAWALMLTGFFGAGALLRRQRRAVLAT